MEDENEKAGSAQGGFISWSEPVAHEGWATGELRPACKPVETKGYRYASHTTVLPQLPAWSFQPDADMPGLYLQCETYEQRDAILRLLGAPTELIVKR